jgi:hypothetical protein
MSTCRGCGAEGGICKKCFSSPDFFSWFHYSESGWRKYCNICGTGNGLCYDCIKVVEKPANLPSHSSYVCMICPTTRNIVRNVRGKPVCDGCIDTLRTKYDPGHIFKLSTCGFQLKVEAFQTIISEPGNSLRLQLSPSIIYEGAICKNTRWGGANCTDCRRKVDNVRELINSETNNHISQRQLVATYFAIDSELLIKCVLGAMDCDEPIATAIAYAFQSMVRCLF